MRHAHSIILGLIFAFVTQCALADQVLNAVVDGETHRTAVGTTADDTQPIIDTSRSGGNNVVVGIFEFDLSSIATGTTIYGATLDLELAANLFNTGSTVNLKVGQYNGNGSVEASDHADYASFAGDIVTYDTTSNGGPGNGDVLTINLDNSTIQAIVDNPGQNILGIRTATENFATFRFNSNEGAAQAGMAPTLTLQTVPEPGSTMLILFGTSFIILNRRRSI